VGDNDFLDLVAENVLQGLGQTFVFLLFLLTCLLLFISLLEFEVLGDVDELLAIELLELSHGILVDGVNKEQNFEVLILERVEERRLLNSLERFTSDVVHVLLVFGHASNVVGERGEFVARLGGVEAKELGQQWAILAVFVDTKLEVLAESSVELVKLLTILGNLIEELKGLLDKVLADDLHDLVLLQGLTRKVERQILRVDDTLDETEPFWNEVGGIIGDEDAAYVQLDVVLRPLGLEQIKGGTLGNEEDGSEFELTLDREVLHGQVVFPVVGEGLVESSVLLGGDVGWVASPNWLRFVEFFLLDGGLLDLLCLFGLVLVFLLVIDFLYLGFLLLILILDLLGAYLLQALPNSFCA